MNHSCVVANVVCIAKRVIFLGEVRWENGVITAIKELGVENPQSPYLLSGFIDAHVHIESSMLSPCQFARLACRHGTVATVSDPHEIANVLGLEGIAFMLENASLTPLQIFLAHHLVYLLRRLKQRAHAWKLNS